MSLRVRFLCGHHMDLGLTGEGAPVCHCGETRVIRTFARPPRFTGACSGPYAETKGLESVSVNLAPGGSLQLKKDDRHGVE